MKTKLYALIALFISCNFLYSCLDDELASTGEYAGKGIQFGLGATSRTVYDTDDESQINWVSSDQITIHCAQAESAKSADYTVTPSEEPTANEGTIAVSSGSTGLQWGGDTDVHHFYAVYPKGVAVDENGIAEFAINHNQKVTVSTTDGYNNDVVATPDMKNAYMVAKNSTAPTDGEVELEFKPIMTTLEIVITGAPEGQNSSDAARITGISISSTTDSEVEGEQFKYDIKTGSIEPEIGTGTEKSTETTFIDLVDAEGNASYVDLANSKKLTVTAFLPPMSTDDAAKQNRQVKIRVHATGDKELVASVKTIDETTDSWTTQLTPSAKRTITLPAIPSDNDKTGNNWITPLDGNIYITDMSIPGTHDAGTGGDSDGIVSELAGMVAADTQETTISEQLNMGIRCFDLRPAQYGNDLRIYHGVVRYKSTFHDALGTITDYLISNPGEFAIVIMRHESEIGDLPWYLYLFEQDQSNWSTLMRESLDKVRTYSYDDSEVTYTIQSKIVKYHPDLTISDMRGKILLITRDDYTYGETGADGKSEGFTNSAVIQDNYITSYAYSNAPYKVQDYYNYGSDQEGKINIIKAMLNQSSSSVTNTLYLNHCSGYQNGDVDLSGYRGNSSVINPEIYNYITSTDFKGSTGIIMLDYVGSHQSGGVTVYGDLLPQAIIDNNYKYRMKRKGE